MIDVLNWIGSNWLGFIITLALICWIISSAIRHALGIDD